MRVFWLILTTLAVAVTADDLDTVTGVGAGAGAAGGGVGAATFWAQPESAARQASTAKLVSRGIVQAARSDLWVIVILLVRQPIGREWRRDACHAHDGRVSFLVRT